MWLQENERMDHSLYLIFKMNGIVELKLAGMDHKCGRFVGIIPLVEPFQTHVSQLHAQLYSHSPLISHSFKVIQGYLVPNYGLINWILAL